MTSGHREVREAYVVLHVKSLDGKRSLAVERWGSGSTKVFLLHGMPGSRSGPRPRGILLERLGIDLISYDRPGYGESDRHPGRRVVDAAADIRAIADALEIPRFSIVGRSGGGPHALAAAAEMAERVDKVAALVSLAPHDADDLMWYENMTDSNVAEYNRADEDAALVENQLRDEAAKIRRNPEILLERLETELSSPDRRIVHNITLRRQLTETYREALRTGAYGWIDDVLAMRTGWGFDLRKITSPTLIWHGAADRFSPVQHAKWLHRHIPHAELEVRLGAAHFTAFEIMPEVLSWIIAPVTAPALSRTSSDR